MLKKPDRPYSSISFSDNGKVKKNIEHTNLEKSELENSIGKKFVSSLKYFNRIKLTNIRKGQEPADLCVDNKDGQNINIQITEVVDQKSRVLYQAREDCKAMLTSNQKIIVLIEPHLDDYL